LAAFPITSEDEVKPIEALKTTSQCRALLLCLSNRNKHNYRANDDGEPNNSAGMPIYGQIQSFGVTNVLLIAVRVFGE
jgi:putative IMPACT (imprinted ancient) family translation regulator